MVDRISLVKVPADTGLKDQVYQQLRTAVVSMDIYASRVAPKLDERALAEELGVSRTPVREALSRLEQEGLVRNIPRRGTFVVRKTKQEIVEIIEVWAALESMAARLVTENASEVELEIFHQNSNRMQSTPDTADSYIDEYSENNIRFHQSIIELSKNQYLIDTARRSFVHMQAIRSSTIRHPARTLQSVTDHRRIIEAIVKRDTTRAELLVREHALKLAQHVKEHVDFLD